MKLFVYILTLLATLALARDYDDYLYEAHRDVLEARDAYFDSLDEYNSLVARGSVIDIAKNFTPKCVLEPLLLPSSHSFSL